MLAPAAVLFLTAIVVESLQAEYLSCQDTSPDTPSKVCAVREVGLPTTYANVSEACSHNDTRAYLVGDCNDLLQTCPQRGLWFHCEVIARSMVPSCGFQDGKPPTDVKNDFCCVQDSYTQVRVGKCPTSGPAQSSSAGLVFGIGQLFPIQQLRSKGPEKVWYLQQWKRSHGRQQVCVVFLNNTRVTTTLKSPHWKSKQIKKVAIGICH